MKLIEILEEMIDAKKRMHVNGTMLNSWIKELAKYSEIVFEEEE